MEKIIIGSHVGMKAPDYFLGSVEEALRYGATSLMLYTGAPQNSVRIPVSQLKVVEAQNLIKEKGLDINKMVCHAPYIINLSNPVNPSLYEMSIGVLKSEMQRTHDMGLTVIVLHPGAYVKGTKEDGQIKLIEALNQILDNDTTGVRIALETMAGKGSEMCTNFEDMAYILNHIHNQNQIGVCLDTCHISDAGYDVHDYEGLISELTKYISLDKILVIHINDSKNSMGTHKDRHENLGYGYIGYEAIHQFVNDVRFQNIPKILETPYVEDKPPYKKEISMLVNGVFEPNWRDNL